MAADSSSDRLLISTLVLTSLGLAGLLSTACFLPLASYLPLLLTIFTIEWDRVHGGKLSRRLRAIFDERNVLETYQPRARTMGHLFEGEPPTPVPDDLRRAQEEKDRFKKTRDAHYAGEYQRIERLNREMRNGAKKVSTRPTTAPFSVLDDDDETDGAEM